MQDLLIHQALLDSLKSKKKEPQAQVSIPIKKLVCPKLENISSLSSVTVELEHLANNKETHGVSNPEEETQVQVTIEFHQILGIMNLKT